MKRLISILLLIVIFSGLQAQYVKTRDLEGWAIAKVRYKINDWRIIGEGQLRMEQNISQISDVLTEVEAVYGGLGAWNIGAGVRGIKHKTSSGDYENRARFHFQTGYSVSASKLSLGFRARYQTRHDIDETELLNVIRFKASARYNPKGIPIDPYASFEAFLLLPGRQTFGFPSARLVAGGIWKMNKSNHLRLFYHLEYNNEEFYPLWIHRIGTCYELRL